MHQIRHNMPAEALRTIYNTLILPCLCYFNGIWGSVCASNLKPLQVIQKRIVKAMYFKPLRYPSAELFVSNFLLSVEQINKYTCCLYVFKSMHSSSSNIFYFLNQYLSYQSKHAMQILHLFLIYLRLIPDSQRAEWERGSGTGSLMTCDI